MTTKVKPKLRMAPTPVALAEQQDAASRLLSLDAWTEVPNNPPPSGAAALVLQSAAKGLPDKPPEAKAPQKPWLGDGAAAPHPYHVVASEGLFQKIDYVWKRQGNKSMREWVLSVLEKEANRVLTEMGEL